MWITWKALNLILKLAVKAKEKKGS